jgi:hypothetical protein
MSDATVAVIVVLFTNVVELEATSTLSDLKKETVEDDLKFESLNS